MLDSSISRREVIKNCLRVGFVAAGSPLVSVSSWSNAQASEAVTILQGTGGGADYLAMYVAQDAGLFQHYNVNAPYKSFPAAAEAAVALPTRSITCAAPVEQPVITLISRNVDIVVPAVICIADEWQFVVQTSIQKPGDLEGKKIGVKIGSGAQYALSTYLASNSIAAKGVQLINLSPADMVGAFARGDIDGFIWLEPQTGQALKVMGARAHVLTNPPIGNYYKSRIYLVFLRSWAESNRTAVEGYLRGLIAANAYIASNAARAAQIGAQDMHLPVDQLVHDWKEAKTDWSLHLNSDDLAAIKKVAAWMKGTNLLQGNINVESALDGSYLKAIDKKLVTIPGK